MSVGTKGSWSAKQEDASNDGGAATQAAAAAAGTSTDATARKHVSTGIVRWTYQFIVAANNTPQPGPCYLVPPGCVVRLRGNNGQAAGNTKPVFVAEYREKLANNQGAPIYPSDDIQMQIDNLAKLWFMGTAADGVVISVQSLTN